MTPEGGCLTGLLLGTVLVTGNMGNLAVGAAAGAAVGFGHYRYHSKSLNRTLIAVEERLRQEGLLDQERRHFEDIKSVTNRRLAQLKAGSTCVGIATVFCPIAGVAFLAADVLMTEKSRTRFRAYLDKTYVS